jgi:hypothetical protein
MSKNETNSKPKFPMIKSSAIEEGAMLKEEDIQVELGRASHGGNFLCLKHIPTGISRRHPGPLRSVNQQELFLSWLSEIEVELREKGPTHHIVAGGDAGKNCK